MQHHTTDRSDCMDLTVGMDIGDKTCEVCLLNGHGEVVRTERIATTREALRDFFGPLKGVTVAIEAGTHSPWISRELEALGCRVLVGNPRLVPLIWQNDRKSDGHDAVTLARLARLDPALLHPIRHRGQQAQADLAIIKARDGLVTSRARLIGQVRGLVKSMGGRVPPCSTPVFHRVAGARLPAEYLRPVGPALETIGNLTEAIRAYDKRLDQLGEEGYPETLHMRQVDGVGPLTSLAFVLTIEDPHRIPHTRAVGAFVGLVPRLDQSGATSRACGISKAGNELLRRLLTQAAQHVLGPFGKPSELRDFGLKLVARGGKGAKKRAVTAVARKLAVLLLALWKSGRPYEPFHNSPPSRPPSGGGAAVPAGKKKRAAGARGVPRRSVTSPRSQQEGERRLGEASSSPRARRCKPPVTPLTKSL